MYIFHVSGGIIDTYNRIHRSTQWLDPPSQILQLSRGSPLTDLRVPLL